MKKIKIISVFTPLLAVIVFYACNKEKTTKYSCDERAHAYAAMHLDADQNISRNELVKLERGIQFAVFRSLSPENKLRIFHEKIDLLLSTLELSTAEKLHLTELKTFNDPSVYNLPEGEKNPELERWQSKAKYELKWTENMIQGMVGTWATPEELKTMVGIDHLSSSSGSCTCRYDIGCAMLGDCKSGCTIPPNGGCGIIGTANCTGNCPEDRIKPNSGISH